MNTTQKLGITIALAALASTGCKVVVSTTQICGNNFIEGSEQCDDGNTRSGDGCSAACRFEGTGMACGNRVIEGTEQCDDGNQTSGDGCSNVCAVEMATANCGDRVLQMGEQCDDGNRVGGDGCSATCQTETATGTPIYGTCQQGVPSCSAAMGLNCYSWAGAGFCSKVCSTDSDCPLNGACYATGPSPAPRVCFARCTPGGNGCATGESCFQTQTGSAQGGTPRPDYICAPPTAFPTPSGLPQYAYCDGAGQCGGANNCVIFPGTSNPPVNTGVCTQACTAGSSCPNGGQCATVNGATFCFASCGGAVGCPLGHFCAQISGTSNAVCVPNGANMTPEPTLYTQCATQNDCLSMTGRNEQCLLVRAPLTGGGTTNGRFCSYGCRSNSDCEGIGSLGGACFGLYGDPNNAQVCYQTCNVRNDCAMGSDCLPTTAGTKICIPMT